MRIQRGYRRSGCLPMKLFTGIVFGMLVASLAWLLGNRSLSLPTPRTSLGSAYGAFEAGDLDTTVQLARRVWNSEQDNIEALALLVRALIYRSYDEYNRSSDREEALLLTTRAYNRSSTDPAVLSLHAFALYSSERPGEALRLAEQALSRDPENTLAQMTTALVYGRFGSHERAVLEHQPTLFDPRWRLDTHRALAISLGNAGRFDEAMRAVDVAIEVNPHLLVLHFERAFYAMQAGDADAATASYFRILADHAANIKARLRLCELSTLLRETTTALHYCQEVTTLAPQWVDGWYRLGREYYLQGNFAQAQQAFHQCSTLSIRQNIPVEQRRFDCWYLQGQAAEVLGDCPTLMAVYSEFQAMSAIASIPQTWTYPPEGPAICLQ
ncbi:MAG: hypothetical protein OHK0046_19560 [Anaerolineae bacterium]